ncbi:MAG: hypothetical protein ACM3H8_14555 [Sphingobacteriales bacterium]
MKNILQLTTFITFFINFSDVTGQGSASSPGAQFSMDARTSINLGNMMGRPFSVNNYDKVKGTPFFIDSFTTAYVMLNGGKVYSIDKLRLNLLTHQLHFLTQENKELIAGDGIVKRVVFNKKSGDSTIPVIFANGYPAIDKFTDLSYYEALNWGKVQVLKMTEKIIANDVSITASPLDKHFEEHSGIYLFSTLQNSMIKWRKGKEFLIDFLKDKTDLIEKYIAENKLDCRSVKQLIMVIDYFNSL